MNLTAFSLLLRFNPLSPRSKNGKVVWEKLENQASYFLLGQRQLIYESLLDSAKKVYEAKNLKWEPHISTLKTRIKSLEEQLKATKDTSVKARIKKELKQVKMNLLTLEVRAEKTRHDSLKVTNEAYDLGWSEILALEARLKSVREKEDKTFTGEVLSYREALIGSGKPIIGLSYSLNLFSLLESSKVDKDEDGLDDNARNIAGMSVTGTLDWLVGKRTQLSALVTYGNKREAEENSQYGTAFGYGLTVGHILKILNPNYRKSEDYIKSLFVPSLVGGLAFEGQECTSDDDDCSERLLRKLVFTPFLDIEIRSSMQFRLAFPLERSTKIEGEGETSIGVKTVFTFQLKTG